MADGGWRMADGGWRMADGEPRATSDERYYAVKTGGGIIPARELEKMRRGHDVRRSRFHE